MPKHYTRLVVHAAWATLYRLPSIERGIARAVHQYLASRCREIGCVPLAIGGIEDHVHVLASLHPSVAVADLVRDLKACSSGFVRRDLGRRACAWQTGYGVFSLWKEDAGIVRSYVREQRAHHARGTTRPEWEETEADGGDEAPADSDA